MSAQIPYYLSTPIAGQFPVNRKIDASVTVITENAEFGSQYSSI